MSATSAARRDRRRAGLWSLLRAIATGNDAIALQLLTTRPQLATATVDVGASREKAKAYYLDQIGHYVYAGDTALHVAAAAYHTRVARDLVAYGAKLDARNRRGATPLHYAADGAPGSEHWNPEAQAAMVDYLIGAGA